MTVTGKIIYVIGGYALLLVLNVFLFQQLVNPTLDVIIVAILEHRLRGDRRAHVPRRRGESRRPASLVARDRQADAGFWIGSGLAVAAGVSLLGALASKPSDAFIPALACVVYGALATFYLHSSYRLRTLDLA